MKVYEKINSNIYSYLPESRIWNISRWKDELEREMANMKKGIHEINVKIKFLNLTKLFLNY